MNILIFQSYHQTLHFSISLIEDFTMESLKNILAKLPKNSAIFYILNFGDNKTKKFIPRDFLKEIAEVSNSPIYSFWSTFIGAGTIGAYMKDGQITAIDTLKSLVHKIKNDEFNSNPNNNQLFLDYEVLKKYNLQNKNFPKEAIIVNKPIPIWKSYPKETFFAISLIILLQLMILKTFINQAKKCVILILKKS